MPSSFGYRARAIDGARIEGTMAAASIESVAAHLRRRALFVTEIAPAGAIRFRRPRLPALDSVSLRVARLAFFRTMGALTSAGVPLSRSIEVAAAQCRNRRLSEALSAVRADVHAGLPLSRAIASRPKEFFSTHTAMITAAEHSGDLDRALAQLADAAQKDAAVTGKLRSALAYPALVCFLACVLFGAMLIFIIPMFARMFAELNVDLPPATRALFDLSAAIRRPAAVASGLAVSAAFALPAAVLARNGRVRAFGARAVLSMPFVGGVIRKSTLSKLARTMSGLLRAGVPLVESIDATIPVCNHAVYAAALRRLREAVRNGAPLSVQLGADAVFDPFLVQLVEAGEETGSVDAMLLRAAEFYEADTDVTLATLSSTIEPVLMCAIGAAVGCIVLSIFYPLYSLVGAIR